MKKHEYIILIPFGSKDTADLACKYIQDETGYLGKVIKKLDGWNEKQVNVK